MILRGELVSRLVRPLAGCRDGVLTFGVLHNVEGATVWSCVGDGLTGEPIGDTLTSVSARKYDETM